MISHRQTLSHCSISFGLASCIRLFKEEERTFTFPQNKKVIWSQSWHHWTKIGLPGARWTWQQPQSKQSPIWLSTGWKNVRKHRQSKIMPSWWWMSNKLLPLNVHWNILFPGTLPIFKFFLQSEKEKWFHSKFANLQILFAVRRREQSDFVQSLDFSRTSTSEVDLSRKT